MEEKITFEMPDNANIPCRNCIFASSFYLDYYCAKYKLKPKEVYYKSEMCPKFKERGEIKIEPEVKSEPEIKGEPGIKE